MLTELCCVLSTHLLVLFTFRLTFGFKAEFCVSCVVLLRVILQCLHTYLNESTLVFCGFMYVCASLLDSQPRTKVLLPFLIQPQRNGSETLKAVN